MTWNYAKMTIMKRILACLLIGAGLCFGGLCLAQEDTIDAKFTALMLWAVNLHQNEIKWNEICSQNPAAEQCGDIRLVLIEQYKYFVECAKRYSISGDDCTAKMRVRWTTHETRVFSWNIDCMLTTKAPACVKEYNAIQDELKQLEKDTEDCVPTKPKAKI